VARQLWNGKNSLRQSLVDRAQALTTCSTVTNQIIFRNAPDWSNCFPVLRIPFHLAGYARDRQCDDQFLAVSFMAALLPRRFPRLARLASTAVPKLRNNASPLEKIEHDFNRLLRVVEKRVEEKARAEREVRAKLF
jgi:hypothetical protein